MHSGTTCARPAGQLAKLTSQVNSQRSFCEVLVALLELVLKTILSGTVGVSIHSRRGEGDWKCQWTYNSIRVTVRQYITIHHNTSLCSFCELYEAYTVEVTPIA